MTARECFTNPELDSSEILNSQLEHIIELQSEILSATVDSNDNTGVLKKLCLLAEKLTPGSLASIMLFRETEDGLFVHTAPSIPEEAIKDLDGLKKGEGSCGNAVYFNEEMYVCDTMSDARWENLQDFADKYNINACWSSPIQLSDNHAVGSFALSSFNTRVPNNFQRRLLKTCASIASIIFQREKSLLENEQAKQKIVESEQRFRIILENTPDALFIINEHAEIVDVNNVACEKLGYTREELMSLKVLDVQKALTLSQFKKLFESLKGDELFEMEGIHKHKDGSEFQVESRVRQYVFNGERFNIVSVNDITHRKQQENELLKVRKLESIGLLAGGIAHDFNNLLSIIMGNIDLANRFDPLPENIERYLTNANNASSRAADLTQQLLTFSKGGEPIRKTADILEIVRESAEFSLHGSGIDTVYNCENRDELWKVRVDSGQISQVIQNLAINARQAMPNGGVLTVSCSNSELTEGKEVRRLKPGKYIKLVIHDSGTGIPEDVIESIFDPYFTTKQEGSGLGLALSYSIINKHRGNISVESTVGVGTSFIIYLPVSDEIFESSEKPEKSHTAQIDSARVMIMDDDEMIREIGKAMLENQGYEVVLAEDGDVAVRKYSEAIEANKPIDLVVMDLTILSGLGGKDALSKIKEIDPDVKGLVSSGYSNDPVMANFEEYGFKGALSKPYNQDSLVQVISDILKQ